VANLRATIDPFAREVRIAAQAAHRTRQTAGARPVKALIDPTLHSWNSRRSRLMGSTTMRPGRFHRYRIADFRREAVIVATIDVKAAPTIRSP